MGLFGKPHWAIAAVAMEKISASAPMPEIDFQIRSFIDFSSSAGDGRLRRKVTDGGPEEAMKRG
jgi:hypothetical protein